MKHLILYSGLLTLILAICMAVPHLSMAQNNAYAPWSASDNASKTMRLAERLNQNEQAGGNNFIGQAAPTDYTTQGQTNMSVQQRAYANAQSHNTPLNPRASLPSPIETMYARRIAAPLEQYGYDMFGVPKDETRNILGVLAKEEPNASAAMPAGAVQDSFILNMGDEVRITFTGQRSDSANYKINNDGLIQIPDFPPIPAAGRTIGQVRISLEAAATNLHNTQTYISLASVRQIGVLVVGHVKKPGRRNLTVFHTVLDALMESGGVDKTGSLRQIKLVRHGRSTHIDLYSLLMHGATNIDLDLRDGDRIIVPPLGPTIAVAGEVKRPAIYEILPSMLGMHHLTDKRSEKISLNDALDFAGGALLPGQNRFLKLGITNTGEERVSTIDDAFKDTFGDGSILMVAHGQDKRATTVELTGHTRKPGIYALDDAKTLSQLIPNERALGADIYPLIGVLERWDAGQLTNLYHAFPLRLLISGEFDRQLHDGDVVHLFSKAQIKKLTESMPATAEQRYASAHGKAEPKPHLRDGYKTDPDYYHEIAQGLVMDMDEQNEDLERTNPVLASFLKERAVFLRGAVRNPGPYPVAEGATLDNLLAVAGGLALEANTNNIEVTSINFGQNNQTHGRSGTHRRNIDFAHDDPADITLSPGDTVRVNQKFKKVEDNSVLIIGEVRSPGRYDLMPGDTVADLLERAGGLSDQAYAPGAIFSREQERRAEESRFRAAARDLERSLAVAIERNDDKSPNDQQIAMARGLALELREAEAVGRITVEADPAVLAANPELDMLLESGDRLYIPKRPLTVRVSGEVLSPASLQFRDKKDPDDYINEAGGFTFHADKDRTFVLYPDGSAKPLQTGLWSTNATFIPPGSSIIVPRDPEPFDFIESAKDISQILSNLAITGIFIQDIRD